MADPSYEILPFDALKGWAAEDHRAALDVFCRSADRITDPYWQAVCHLAPTSTDPQGFFELYFHPVLISDGAPMVFTGYFEPELTGALQKDARYRFPVYALPPKLPPGTTRKIIEETDILSGHEILYLDDPVDVFFLHVQGSGRVRLPDGSIMRLGFAGKNGLPYTSVGKAMIARGIAADGALTADIMADWLRQHQDQARALMQLNESYVFFRHLQGLAPDDGPLSAMKCPVTPWRSIAVDPDIVPLGAPVWIEKQGAAPLHRLMVAQDTGSAIKGAQRADIFTGTGAQAGLDAGRIHDPGRMVTLLPRAVAEKLAGAD
jgi:membrane-bound lytic murein transglycosylase A